jgi:hypothetical protein
MHTQKEEENSQKNNATKKKKKFKKMCVCFGTFLSETNPTLQPSKVVVELEEEGTICCHVRHNQMIEL